MAKRLKEQILERTGLTASAGVAPNKFLAKIASGYRKPDGLTVISPERVESFLQELPVEALWGVGPVTAKKLRAIGLERLVQVRDVDMDEEEVYTLVGSGEEDYDTGKILVTSPLGQGLLGKKIGEYTSHYVLETTK